jgi:hypothetical protein
VLAQRIAAAAWRLARADRIEAELLVYRCADDGDLARALIRDGNGTRSFETLLRYRASALAELMRSLRMLKTLQAEQAATPVRAAGPAPVLAFEPKRTRGTVIAPRERAGQGTAREKNPNEPETCSRPGDPAPARPLPGPEQSWVRQASPSPS